MRPIYLRNATRLGYSKISAEKGDLVFWQCDEANRSYVGRVIGAATHDGCGNEYRAPSTGRRTKKAPRLHVLMLGENMHHAYPVHVDPDDVRECRAPMSDKALAFISWFFGGALPDAKAIEASSHAGALSTNYFADSTRDGMWIPFSERKDAL